MYVPYTQSEIKGWPNMQSMQFALRTQADPASIAGNVRNAVHEVDPDLPIAGFVTLTTLVDTSMSADRLSMLLLAAFGFLALLLAAIGMYGVISYAVLLRTPEIGIRIALGAQRGRIFVMVLTHGGRLGRCAASLLYAGAQGHESGSYDRTALRMRLQMRSPHQSPG
jgi:hypothetical protein